MELLAFFCLRGVYAMLQDDSQQTNMCRAFVWDQDLDERLLHFREQGYTFPRIAQILECPSVDIVRKRYRKLVPLTEADPTPAVTGILYTDEEKLRFQALYAQQPRIAMSGIAEMLGRTKNSVCSLRRRLKLKSRPRVAESGKKNPYRPTNNRRQDGKSLAPRKTPDPSDYNTAQANLEAAALQGFVNGGKTLLELGSRDCRFIDGDPRVGGHRFCGARTVEGKSWCAGHFAVVMKRI